MAVEIRGRVYTYFPLAHGETISVPVRGPVEFEAIARLRFGESDGPADVELEISVDGAPPWRQVFRARPGDAVYPEIPGARAGAANRLNFYLPSGPHTVRMTLASPSGGVLDLNLLSKAPDELPWMLGWRLEMGSSYDTNVFRYSDSDVDDFLDGARAGRYGMNSVDDLRLEPSAEFSLIRERPGARTTTVSFSSDWRLAASNGEKSFAKLGVGMRELREGVAYLEVEYSAIPSYHLRLLWDTDAEGGAGEYRSCDFRKHAFGVELGSDGSLPVDLSVGMKVETYAYDPDFTEYDSVAKTVAARATVRPARGVRVDLGYALRGLVAAGSDEPGETRATSDDSDTTYEQDRYTLRVRWEAGKWWGRRAVLIATAGHSRRYYLASRVESDPYHAGREDKYWSGGGRLRLELSDAAGLEGFYQYRSRTAESPLVEDLGELKDYGAHRLGLLVYLEGGQFLD
ncbi:MAG: hypothetical protein ABIG03_03910 [Candidatus Eisenbacteria bacterium]